MWTLPVISWFLTPSNYRYLYHTIVIQLLYNLYLYSYRATFLSDLGCTGYIDVLRKKVFVLCQNHSLRKNLDEFFFPFSKFPASLKLSQGHLHFGNLIKAIDIDSTLWEQNLIFPMDFPMISDGFLIRPGVPMLVLLRQLWCSSGNISADLGGITMKKHPFLGNLDKHITMILYLLNIYNI